MEEWLCAWLLLLRDRMSTTELLMTHDRIAQMLGVRRDGVALAAGRLQAAGLIRSARGRIRILDRRGLEGAACKCYRAITHEHARLSER